MASMNRQFPTVVGFLMFCGGVVLGLITSSIVDGLQWEAEMWEAHPDGRGFMRMTGLDFGVVHVSQDWIGGFTASFAALSVLFVWIGFRFIITGRFFRRA